MALTTVMVEVRKTSKNGHEATLRNVVGAAGLNAWPATPAAPEGEITMTQSSPGDPEGRRLARRRAHQLSEAARLAEIIARLLGGSGLAEACSELAKRIAERERAELQRAYGRLEPRNRFPTLGSHPLLLGAHGCIISIDECGRPEPESTRHQPVFALGAVGFDEEDVNGGRAAADALKLKFFGTVDLTFHEPDIRTRDGPYRFGGNAQRQAEFEEELAALIDDTKFVAFGAAIRKDVFDKEFVKPSLTHIFRLMSTAWPSCWSWSAISTTCR